MKVAQHKLWTIPVSTSGALTYWQARLRTRAAARLWGMRLLLQAGAHTLAGTLSVCAPARMHGFVSRKLALGLVVTLISWHMSNLALVCGKLCCGAAG